MKTVGLASLGATLLAAAAWAAPRSSAELGKASSPNQPAVEQTAGQKPGPVAEKALPADWVWIVNRATGLHLNCQDSQKPGTAIVQSAGHRPAGGKTWAGAWRLETSGDAVKIRSEYSKLLLAIDEHASPSAAAVCQSEDHGQAAALWKIEPAADGYWTITNLLSGQSLEAAGKTRKSPLKQSPRRTAAAEQQWRFDPAGIEGGASKTPVAPTASNSSPAQKGEQRPAAASGKAPRQDGAAKEQQVDLRQFVEEHFSRWDSNHNGVLDHKEIDRAIEDRSVQGREAAAIVAISRLVKGAAKAAADPDKAQKMEKGGFGSLAVVVSKTEKHPNPHASMTHEELLALAATGAFEKAVNADTEKLQIIDRRLFAPGDPNLSSFHQGRSGDCYLLSMIGAAIHRNPKVIHEMIHPAGNDGFEVHFADGKKIHVPALTDGELLLGARMNETHGIWLAVLEKAWGEIREKEEKKDAGGGKKGGKNGNKAPPEEAIGGGNAAKTISLLTGHGTETVFSLKKNNEQGKVVSEPQIHELLTRVTRQRRLAGCSATGQRPPGIVGHHSYGIFGYDSKRREVQVFNPWGQEFQPQGPPGLANGYPTHHGVFTVPLAEFVKIFGHVVYETGGRGHDDKKER